MNTTELLPEEALREESDPVMEFEAALEEAARAVDAEPWVVQRMKHAEREIKVNLPLVRDDGSAMNVTGYRVQHSRAHGPCIGSVTLSATAQLASLRTMATGITLQSALLGLRLGGAAGAIVVDPDQLSERELRHVIKEYVIALHESTGPLRDVLVACDGNNYIATWMDEANAHARGQSEPAAIVGKPDDGMDAAWAGATAAAVQRVLHADTLKDTRITIQGFGRRARALVSVLQSQGAKVVAVADRSGGLMCESGIDVAALENYSAQSGVIFGFPGADAASNADVLESECDVLILAAAQRQIGSHNAARIRAKVIFELAEGAVTEAGEGALAKPCMVVPHLLASAAQLAIWAHEWQRGLAYSAPDPEKAESDATVLVTNAYERATELAGSRQCSVRAAMLIAMERLASVLRKT